MRRRVERCGAGRFDRQPINMLLQQARRFVQVPDGTRERSGPGSRAIAGRDTIQHRLGTTASVNARPVRRTSELRYNPLP